MTVKNRFSQFVSVAAISTVFCFASPAFADVSTEADALFKQAQDLLAEKKIDAACAAFERSEKLEPRGGTLLSLAYCHEQQSRIALAFSEYDEALRRLRVGGGRQDRERFALERMSALRGQVVMVTVDMSEAVKAQNPEILVVPSKPGDTERKIAQGTDRRQQVALDVDGGAYRIELRAPGTKPYVAQVTVAGPNATPAVLTVAELVGEPGAAGPSGPSKPQPAEPEKDGSGQRVAGLVIGGAGIAVLAVGAVFGVMALECAKDVREGTGCDEGTAKGPYGWTANLGIGLGAAAVLGGGYLYFSAPKGNSRAAVGVAPTALPGGGGLSMTGRF